MPSDEAMRLWNGDVRAVVHAQQQYAFDRRVGLLPYAVALYSFRHKSKYRKELIALLPELLSRAEEVWLWADSVERTAEQAHACDVLSTHLEWITRQGTLSMLQQQLVLRAVDRLCRYGIDCVGEVYREAHTAALLTLTSVRVGLREKSSVWGALDTVVDYAEDIHDPMQRARVYAKLGYLYRKDWWLLDGYWWGIQAILVPGITGNVRLKAFALLLGFDR
jgi:hypothetical protein